MMVRSDDEYRLLRQNLFERVPGATTIPQEEPIVQIAGPSKPSTRDFSGEPPFRAPRPLAHRPGPAAHARYIRAACATACASLSFFLFAVWLLRACRCS